MQLFNNPTRFLFFTGKGGVGKTSLSCSVAVALADQGKKVFLVCTDPASNLSDVLGTGISAEIIDHPDVAGLKAVNIDPEESARRYREKVIGPYRGKLPEAALASMEEQLSGACTMEIAAFDEFAAFLGRPELLAAYDHVVFDTAPTGHTLRLLQLPAAWDGFIETNTTGTSCLGPLAGLTRQHEMYKNTIRTLTDVRQTTVVLVCRPDAASLAEAERTSGELAGLGIENQELCINGLFRATTGDPIAQAWQDRAREALEVMPEGLRKLNSVEIPLLPFAPLGVERLRRFSRIVAGENVTPPPVDSHVQEKLPLPVSELFAKLAAGGKGVVMVMGKGGVGKTTLATELATCLAQKGQRVVLATTDPASHLDFSLERTLEQLTVKRIDPKEETRKYTEKVMTEAGSCLDDQGRKLLEEDLRSPCTEEIAVFHAFAELVDQGGDQFVVLDTAPTGHTLLLLDAAQSYHREVQRTAQAMPEGVQKLLPRMRDQEFTRILVVTLPETTPVHEARQLEADLQRARIVPYGWIVNQSLAPLELSDPLLCARRAEELPLIGELVEECGERLYLAQWR